MKLNKIYLIIATCGLFCNAATAQSDSITATYSGSINSGYTGTFGSGGCLYTLPVVIPPEFSVTNIKFTFWFRAYGTCTIDSGGYTISLGSCKTQVWSGPLHLPGLEQSSGLSIYNDLNACLPTSRCDSDTLNFVLDFFRANQPGGNCGSSSCIVEDATVQWSISVMGVQNHLPVADFNLVQDTTQLHHYIATNNAAGKAPLSYDWSWGDGTHDYTAYPTHTYADSGFYGICLTITDSTGCQNTFCDSSFYALRTTNTMVYITVLNPLVTGTQEVILQTPQMTIYPNPATNQLTIHSTSFQNEALTVSIINLLGQETSPPIPLHMERGVASIDVSGLPSGMYFLQMKSERGSVVKKFVKE